MTPDENPLVDRAERLRTLVSRLSVQLEALEDAVTGMTGPALYRDGWEPTPFGLDETRRWCESVDETAGSVLSACHDLERATATLVVFGRGI